MSVLTISRQYGAGGKTLGKQLAKRLGRQLVYRDVLRRVAEEANVSLGWVESVHREAGGRLMRILANLVSSDFIERHVGDSGSDFDEKRYVEFLTKVIEEVARQGDAVIVGQGSQFILANDPGTVRVLLVAPLEHRIVFLQEKYGLTREKAEALIQKEQMRRSRFLRSFVDSDPDDPGLYHLAINTGLVGLDQAEEIIVDLLEKLGK